MMKPGMVSATSLLKPTEKQIKDSIVDWINRMPGGFCWVQNQGSAVREYTIKTGFRAGQTTRHMFRAANIDGISDIIGGWYGRPLAIEVKVPGKKASIEQKSFLNQFERKSNAIAIEVHSLEEAQNILLPLTEKINN